MVLQPGMTEFLNTLFSSSPVPGGGGASALVGSMAAALGGMVTNLTIGKKRYAAFEEELLQSRGALKFHMDRLVALVEEDAKGFEPLSKAYGLSKETEEERMYREQVMEEALFQASLAPLEMMRESIQVMRILSPLVEKGSTLAVSDVGVGILFGWSALEGASLNVFINTKMMKDRKRANLLEKEAFLLKKEGEDIRKQVYERVCERVNPLEEK